jgi:hypothetical protein
MAKPIENISAIKSIVFITFPGIDGEALRIQTTGLNLLAETEIREAGKGPQFCHARRPMAVDQPKCERRMLNPA